MTFLHDRQRPYVCWVGAWAGVLLLLSSCSGTKAPAPTPVSFPRVIPSPPLAIPPVTLPHTTLTEDQQILHVLTRLGYGARPGDVEQVRHAGLAVWIGRQLQPDLISDEKVDRLLQAYPTLEMRTTELLRVFPPPQKGQSEPGKEMAMEQRPARIVAEAQAARLVRAVMSERQLREVMVDFWLNHFNVYAHKGAVKWMLPSYEREAIRPHALGKFGDLLLATARQPAMLFYLDNWLSTRADFVRPGKSNGAQPSGLNENYARELLELHTLGVDGGYAEQDVREVARCFTGWTIERPHEIAQFVYRAKLHDPGSKRVLGTLIPAGGGEQDGRQVLTLLVHHPSTARFIARKLVRRFVSDEPPETLVARAAQTFKETDGDIRAVVAMIATSPEFFSAEAYRAKIKTPLEFAASAVRAVGGEIATTRDVQDAGFQLSRAVARMGEPLYESQPPTGYPDVAEAWVNPGALLTRMNFALALTQQRLPGVRVNLNSRISGADPRLPDSVLDRLLATLLYNQVTPATRAILAGQLAEPEITHATSDDHGMANTDTEKLTALVLGSPEFQRR